MSGLMDEHLEASMRHLEEVRVAGLKLTARLADLSHTRTSRRKLFSVTVGAGGELLELTFNGESYRSLAPAELARMIVDTVAEARESIQEEVSELVNTSMPDADEGLEMLTAAGGLEGLMSELLGSMDVGPAKPKPRTSRRV